MNDSNFQGALNEFVSTAEGRRLNESINSLPDSVELTILDIDTFAAGGGDISKLQHRTGVAFVN